MKFKKFVPILLVLLIASFLRIYKIDTVPVSLFGDELDLGYQAYSILKTGRDYTGNFLPMHFHSLAEWRTPLYLYSAVPTVALFGISPLGVRLPAVIFGILGVLALYLLVDELPLLRHRRLAILASFLLAISPWHIQYSRAGFEVTQMLFFLLMGLYLFFRSLREGKWLWVSLACFCLTPWDYSTAKLFTPLLLTFLLVAFRKQIFKISKIHLLETCVAGVLFGAPIAFSTVFGGGTARFNYISVFSDPTITSEIGFVREFDAKVRGETGTGLKPTIIDKIFYNKVNAVSEVIAKNYFQAFSFNFLFSQGDPNLRHSPTGMGEFYKVEIIALALGSVLFFTKVEDKKIKGLFLFWIIVGAMPSVLTRDGGNHSTRLILILPPLIFLIAYGLAQFSKIPLLLYGLVLLTMFVSYQHIYWVNYPWTSERWWHSGFAGAFSEIKKDEKSYDKIIITTADEPPWTFFAGWLEFPPSLWQQNYPFPKVDYLGFGQISHIGKYYFGSPQIGGLYDWGKVLDSKTLYMASQKEVKLNLVLEPERTPADLQLVKAITFPSGEPAFYLFSGR